MTETDPLAPPAFAEPASVPTVPRPAAASPAPPAAVHPADPWAVLCRLRPLEAAFAVLGVTGAAAEKLTDRLATYRVPRGPLLIDPADLLAALAAAGRAS